MGLKGADVLAVSSVGELALSLGHRFTMGWESRGTLARMPLGGGAPREVLEGVQDADWSPDGQNLAVVREVGARRRLEYPIGRVLYETGGWVSHVRVRRDGREVAFLDHANRGDNQAAVKVVGPDGLTRTVSPSASNGLAWSASGDDLLFPNGSSLRRRASPAGRGPSSGSSGWRCSTTSRRQGRVLVGRTTAQREIVGRAPGEARDRNLSWLDWSFPTALSDDGRRRALRGAEPRERVRPVPAPDRRHSAGPAGGRARPRPVARRQVGARDPRGRRRHRAGPAADGRRRDAPRGSARGRRPGRRVPARRRARGDLGPHAERGGTAVHLRPRDERPLPDQPRGRHVVLQPRWCLPTEGRPSRRDPTGSSPCTRSTGASPASCRERRATTSRSAGRPTGGRLFVQSRAALPARVERVDVATGERQPWLELTPPDPAGVQSIGPVHLSADGKAYVYSIAASSTSSSSWRACASRDRIAVFGSTSEVRSRHHDRIRVPRSRSSRRGPVRRAARLGPGARAGRDRRQHPAAPAEGRLPGPLRPHHAREDHRGPPARPRVPRGADAGPDRGPRDRPAPRRPREARHGGRRRARGLPRDELRVGRRLLRHAARRGDDGRPGLQGLRGPAARPRRRRWPITTGRTPRPTVPFARCSSRARSTTRARCARR